MSKIKSPRDALTHILALSVAVEANSKPARWSPRMATQVKEAALAGLAAADERPVALDEWLAKTDWVQAQIATFPITALGKHRADIMREEIERLRAAANLLAEICDMQQRNYGNGMETHIALIGLCEKGRTALGAPKP